MSRIALAKEVGVNQATMWRWEQGRFRPSGLALRQLERTLNRLERRRAPASRDGQQGAAGTEEA